MIRKKRIAVFTGKRGGSGALTKIMNDIKKSPYLEMKLIIAEVGSVHDGSFNNAIKLIDLAKKCKVDVVKFQTHIYDKESLHDAPSPPYFKKENRYDYFKRISFSKDEWFELKKYTKSKKLLFMSSPFCHEAVDLLESINIDLYKIPSGEVTNTPLLEYVSKTNKPIFLSTGMSNWKEIDRAVKIFKKNKNQLTVMQCTSMYPCENKFVGINLINELKKYNIPIGFSDHTNSLSAAIGAIFNGAVVIEKHITFSREMYGSDAKFAMEPNEFTNYVKEIKNSWEILENPINKNDLKKFSKMKKVFEKSIVTKVAIQSNTRITKDHITFKKPGTGIPPWRVKEVLNKKLKQNLSKNTIIKKKYLK